MAVLKQDVEGSFLGLASNHPVSLGRLRLQDGPERCGLYPLTPCRQHVSFRDESLLSGDTAGRMSSR